MWKEIEESFEKFPAQKKVALFLLKHGFSVAENNRIMCAGVEVQHTRIAQTLEIDRRAVDAAASKILKNRKLKSIYANLQPVAFLRDAAQSLGLGVIVITADDASKPGIVGAVASEIARQGVAIRQAIADDPYLTENPQLTIITDGKITGALFEALKKIKGIKNITIF